MCTTSLKGSLGNLLSSRDVFVSRANFGPAVVAPVVFAFHHIHVLFWRRRVLPLVYAGHLQHGSGCSVGHYLPQHCFVVMNNR